MGKRLLDAGKKREIIAIISVGCSHKTAAKYAGCHHSTIKNEMHSDAEFATDIARAEEQSEVYYVQKIKKAAEKEQYWRAAAWALERRIPNRYGSRGANTLTVEQVKTFLTRIGTLVVSEISDSELREKILRRIKNVIKETDSAATRKNSEENNDDYGE